MLLAGPPGEERNAAQEVQFQTGGFNAEFGRATGGIANVVTKSGTSKYSGSAYEFFRNDVFDARNFFSENVEPLKQNQFGGTIGGPIKQNKTFFFGYYEGFRNRRGSSSSFRTIPSLWMKSFLLSAARTSA